MGAYLVFEGCYLTALNPKTSSLERFTEFVGLRDFSLGLGLLEESYTPLPRNEQVWV